MSINVNEMDLVAFFILVILPGYGIYRFIQNRKNNLKLYGDTRTEEQKNADLMAGEILALIFFIKLLFFTHDR